MTKTNGEDQTIKSYNSVTFSLGKGEKIVIENAALDGITVAEGASVIGSELQPKASTETNEFTISMELTEDSQDAFKLLSWFKLVQSPQTRRLVVVPESSDAYLKGSASIAIYYDDGLVSRVDAYGVFPKAYSVSGMQPGEKPSLAMTICYDAIEFSGVK